MQTVILIAFLGAVFAVLLFLARLGQKPWYPKGFAVAFAASVTLVIGSIGAFGMWSQGNDPGTGEPGPVDLR